LDIFIRPACLKDKHILFKWVNSNDSIKFKIKTNKKISFIEHEEWFEERLIDKNTFIWIIEDNSIPIGQIRFQYSIHNFYEVDIFIMKKYRKLGVASFALKEAEKVSKIKPLRAIIKNNNQKSYAFFLKNGFCLNSTNEDYVSLVKV
jgi:RimJ/RimL family protein N-acetyltransferase